MFFYVCARLKNVSFFIFALFGFTFLYMFFVKVVALTTDTTCDTMLVILFQFGSSLILTNFKEQSIGWTRSRSTFSGSKYNCVQDSKPSLCRAQLQDSYGYRVTAYTRNTANSNACKIVYFSLWHAISEFLLKTKICIHT